MTINDTLIEQLPIPGLLADGILMLHAGIVMFVVVGQILIVVGWWQNWDWARSFWLRFLHLITIVVVMVQSWLGQLCPLTIWEQQLRAAAGKATHDKSFMEFWLSRILFYDLPWWAFVVAYTAFGVLVLVTWWRFPPLSRRARQRART